MQDLVKKFTQRWLARAISFTASTNCCVEGEGMHILSAPICIRVAFWSGRNKRRCPFSPLKALAPSSNPCRFSCQNCEILKKLP